jgi:hypothetical protein
LGIVRVAFFPAQNLKELVVEGVPIISVFLLENEEGLAMMTIVGKVIYNGLYRSGHCLIPPVGPDWPRNLIP